MIFTDTPGIFRARKDFTLEKRISGLAWKVVRSSSVVMLLIDGVSGLTKETYDILEDFKRREKTLIIVINKIDKISEKNHCCTPVSNYHLLSSGNYLKVVGFLRLK